MSFIKSILITCLIFLTIGIGIWGFNFIAQENEADKKLALIKDLYKDGKYEQIVDKIGENIPNKNKEEFLFIKFKSLLELGKFYEAEVISKNLLAINSKNDNYYYFIGLLYYNLGEFKDSIDNFSKAIELQPKNIDYKLNLARLYSQNNEKEKAIKIYKEIMTQDPRYEVAWDEMANIYNSSGKKSEALKLRREAAKKFPNNSYDQYMLGLLCDELKLKQEAIAAYKQALKLQPDADVEVKNRLEKLTGKPYLSTTSMQEKIPLHGLGGILIADVEINRFKGKFMIDTGASTSIIYEKFLKRNKIKAVCSSYNILTMANGNKAFAPLTYVDIKLGKHILKDSRISILQDNKDLNIDGIIGMDVLNNYNIQLDKDKQNLIISK